MEFQTLNTDIIQGSAILHDVFGRPVMKLVVKQPRVLLKHGLNSLAFLIFCGVLTTVAFGGIVFLLLEKLVLRRLRMMSDEVDHIGISGASLHRVSVSGRDELTKLAENINRMIETIEVSREEIR